MNYAELLQAARGQMGPCRACPVCNGRACGGNIPGPGAKGSGTVAIRNFDAWRNVRLNMDTIHENFTPDTSLQLFGRTFKYPFFAGPVGAMTLHYGDKYNDMDYNAILVPACAAAGIAAFTGDGTNPKVMEGATAAIAANGGFGIPTVKPWDNAKLLETLKTAYNIRTANRKGISIATDKLVVSKESGMFWGESNAMQQLRSLIEKVARTDANILVTGENGTGKEMLAREIHLLSNRKKETLVPVDMGAITETLFESELFGHVKGAFTDARADRPGKFEVANKGTLFLDEIGNLSYHLQAKLLTALQRRSIVRVGSNTPIPVNIRLICATNRDLQEMVQKGDFREDLLYRINTIHVEIPPLRERPEDIVPLTEIFLSKYTKIYGKTAMCLSLDAKEKLKAQPWFGNIRELEHTIEKAVIIAERSVLDGNDFDFPRAKKKPVTKEATTLEEMEYNMIKNAMDKYSGNLSLVASQLGISRQTLYNKIKRYEL